MEKRKINTLILSAGRRVELTKLFKKALEKLNLDGKIITADINNTAPALQFSDRYYLISRIDSENYIDDVVNICLKEDIDLVIPTIDTELLKLAENKEKIETLTKAKINISSLEVINICRDKLKTQEFFQKNGFGVPKLITEKDILENKLQFPLFIKPFNGSSSINTFKIKNKEELMFFKNYVSQPVIQEFIEGKEYTVDVFLDFESNPITIVPRQRLTTRSGEISKGLIIKNRKIIDDIKKLINVLKPVGHITIQCMDTREGIKYIEINPRFGGGAPMSISAGADSCVNLYKIILGEKLTYTEEYKENLLCVRYDETLYIDKEKDVIFNV
ncbi:MAG: ATP-grasp domain-containing protein [Fusobacterium sp.]